MKMISFGTSDNIKLKLLCTTTATSNIATNDTTIPTTTTSTITINKIDTTNIYYYLCYY